MTTLSIASCLGGEGVVGNGVGAGDSEQQRDHAPCVTITVGSAVAMLAQAKWQDGDTVLQWTNHARIHQSMWCRVCRRPTCCRR